MTARTRLGLVNTVSMEPATRIARSKAYLTRRLEKTLSRSLLSRVAVIKSQIFAGGVGAVRGSPKRNRTFRPLETGRNARMGEELRIIIPRYVFNSFSLISR